MVNKVTVTLKRYLPYALLISIVIAAVLAPCVGRMAAQRTPVIGASELIQTLEKLNVLGSLLMIGAHPDDENTAVIAYFARGRHIRTAYLSATRGEGGQNLIGPEQYEALGLIRTQELLAARRIDGGEQFFTRAFDFGFSKSPEEALEKWGRDRLLSDFVRVIRRFRPDVIVARFPPSGSGGHGQHTATGHLAPAAFEAAGDPSRFPDQIREGLRPWRAKRLVWNTFAFNRRQEQAEAQAKDRIVIDAGVFNPVLGKSYAEIAGESRTEHASQGMGAPERKGPSRQYFAHVAGEPVADPARGDLFEGIDTTWERVQGGGETGRLLREALQSFRPQQPEAILPLLLDAYAGMERLHDPWVDVKRAELLRAIRLAAGLSLEAEADRWNAAPGSPVGLAVTAINRSHFPLIWDRVAVSGVHAETLPAYGRPLEYNRPETIRCKTAIPAGAPYSQPYWMRGLRTGDYYPVEDPELIGAPENPPALEATFFLRTSRGLELPFRAPVEYRWVERVGGEQARALEIVPPVSVAFSAPALIFPGFQPRRVVLRVASNAEGGKGRVSLDLPAGWKAVPSSAAFELAGPDQQAEAAFEVTPPGPGGSGASGGFAAARAAIGGVTVALGLVSLHYPHIPRQAFFPPARVRMEAFDARLTAKNIGYIMGAGDEIPGALEQLGASVKLLASEDLRHGDLSGFDAIVCGIRALNVRDDVLAARQRLLDYVRAGGTLVVQYNTAGEPARAGSVPRAAQLAPYPLTPSSNRVTVETAPVTFPNPGLPVLHRPNEITARDFEGWVQERGLYFMSQWDERYQPVFACSDPGETPQLGGTLYARYGKGVYIFTGYSWFRQLPAGVPGAYRIFANLVSAGK
jgi:LmbE family N-acetylglucosaminyl deacetylase